MKKFSLFLCLLGAWILGVQAQFYSSGQSPASVKWKQIQTDHFQIIFDSENEKIGQEVARTLNYMYDFVSKDLNHKARKISVVLLNHPARSNGLVVWAPRRMEILTTPPQNESLDSWLGEVCVHELRHVVQIDKLHQGITKLASYVLGEQITGAVSGMVPPWFLEGDAVYAETKFGVEGRGRIPAFSMPLKALALDSSFYSYDKFLMGSYRDVVPDHYAFGYQLVKHGYEKYGDQFWENNLNYAARKPYTLFPYYFSIKKQTGLSRKEFFRETFKTKYKAWAYDDEKEDNKLIYLTKKNKNYVSYRFPVMAGECVYAYKTSTEEIPAVVCIYPSGKEERVYEPGLPNINSLSVHGNKLYVNEWIPDARWGNRSYSAIREIDLQSGLKKWIGKKSRLYSSKLSPEGNRIASVEIDLQNNYFLTIHDVKSGEILHRIPSYKGFSIQEFSWDGEGNKLAGTFINDGSKGICEYNLGEANWSEVLRVAHKNLSKIQYSGNNLIFQAAFTKKDEIYLFDRESQKYYRLSNARFGALDPSLDGDKNILFSNYISKGYRLAKKEINKNTLFDTSGFKEELYPDLNTENVSQIIANKPDSSKLYESKKYSKLKHLFNFHSWVPVYTDYDKLKEGNYQNASVGIQFLSQNKLSTSFLNLGYERRKGMNYYHVNYRYKGWYPVIELSYDYGGYPSVLSPKGDLPGALYGDRVNLEGKVYIPFNLTRSKFITGFTPSVSLNLTNDHVYEDSWKRGLSFLETQMYFYSFKKLSRKDIISRLGFSLSIKNYYSAKAQTYLGNIWYGRALLNIPGFGKHHAISLSGSSEKQNFESRVLGGYDKTPRGYSDQALTKSSKFTVDYVFPLAFPDLSIGSFVYIKRVGINLFYDWQRADLIRTNSKGNYISKGEIFESVGYEMRFKWHAFRTIYPLTTGIRSSYRLNDNSYFNELLFGISFGEL